MAVFDVIIAGAGPAGITAAIYAARKKSTLLVITMDIGGQTLWSGDVENYTGYQLIPGSGLVKKFESHLRQFPVNLRESEEIRSVEPAGNTFKATSDKSAYEARSVIIATGAKSRQLNVPGEERLKNRGVQYCAVCDAPLFPGKDVAVIGGGNSAIEAAVQLTRIASRVYIINNTPRTHGDQMLYESISSAGNAEFHNGTEVREIHGENFVDGITVEKKGRQSLIPVQGVFVEIGLVPNSGIIEKAQKNDKNEIIVNCVNETSMPGVFAAGDVTNVPEKQIIIAAGEGAKAALSACRYADRQAAS